MINICANYLRYIICICNEKYKWVQVDNIYDIITNVRLFHMLHIKNGDICGRQNEIVTKRLSEISNASAYELSSATKSSLYRYK